MTDAHYTITSGGSASEGDLERVHQGLSSHNEAQAGPSGFNKVQLLVHDRGGEVRAGATAEPGNEGDRSLMMKGKILERAIVLLDEAPEWLRPLIAGPVILVAWMTANGAQILGPILVLLLLWFSDDRWQALLDGSRILTLIFGSSALGGLLYVLMGKPLKSILPFGWIPAGWVAVLPYMRWCSCFG